MVVFVKCTSLYYIISDSSVEYTPLFEKKNYLYRHVMQRVKARINIPSP